MAKEKNFGEFKLIYLIYLIIFTKNIIKIFKKILY